VRSQHDQAITQAVAEINSVTSGIAELNGEVAAARGASANENNLVDRRQQLLDRLAGLVDISYHETESGSVNVTTRQGALLVTGGEAHAWQVANGTDNTLRVFAAGKDITSVLQSGKLGGLIQVRDTKINSYLAALDDMAAAVLSRVNTQHALGADADGLAGGNFFAPFTPATPGSNQGAARALEVAITDTRKIAAGDPAAGSGSNQNAKALAGIQDSLILAANSASLTGFYANLVFRIGLDAQTSVDGLETQQHLVSQLQSQRDSQSGVSLDEEAISLMRYQKAFEATSRFITVVNALTEDVINILGG
jgi:flagellar hook-associated protein 1